MVSNGLAASANACIIELRELRLWGGSCLLLPKRTAYTTFHFDKTGHRVTFACCAGLINTHHHMFQALTRCIAQDQKLFGWLKAMYAGWQHIKARAPPSPLALTSLDASLSHLSGPHVFTMACPKGREPVTDMAGGSPCGVLLQVDRLRS